MTIEEFIRLGERMRMREELSKINNDTPRTQKVNFNTTNQLSNADVKFIQKEFEKDVLERDWTRLYDILNHLKRLSHSLIVHEIKL